MRRLTLCMAYYDNPTMWERQLENLDALPPAIKQALAVIVVDDGSPRWPAAGRDVGIPLSIFRIAVDVRWNQDAARNIAVHECTTPWVLLTDMDHIVPCGTYVRVLSGPLDDKTVYRFSRATLHHDGPDPLLSPYKPHPNSWLMTRPLYTLIGGYDERFAGFYGTDADFRDRVCAVAPVEILKEILIRVPREIIPDASTTTYERKAPIDGDALLRIKAARALEHHWTPQRLSFPYAKVYECTP